MKKPLLALVLSLCMMFTMLPHVNVSADTSYNEYQKMLEAIKPENNYGLSATAQGSAILRAWNWSFENITKNLETIAEQGFSTILVSPPNELKMPTKSVKVIEPAIDGVSPNGWWMFYEPAGFQLNESADNALGVKTEFVDMCDKAHELGLKIMVDAVVGYMGTVDDHVGTYVNESTNPMDHVNARAWEFEPEILEAKAFHDPWVNMTYKENYWDGWDDFDIEEDLTQHAIGGKPDLATETQLVQDVIYDYLVELVEAGTDGFYFRDIKHIETSHDTYFASNFWENTLLKLRANYPDKESFALGEHLNKLGDGRSNDEYSEIMDLTNSSVYWKVKDYVVNNGTTGGPNFDIDFNNMFVWDESPETYIDGGTSNLTVAQRNKIWALSAARKGATGVYFVRPDDTPAANSTAVASICDDHTLGDAHQTAWTNPEVSAVNQFANYFADADEACSKNGAVSIIEKGSAGAVIVDAGDSADGITVLARNLTDGKYTDTITGKEFIVSNGFLSGEIGATGIAVIYLTEEGAFGEVVNDPAAEVTIGERTYSVKNLNDALGMAADYPNSTIKLLKDVEGDLNISGTYTLDLGGKTVSNIYIGYQDSIGFEDNGYGETFSSITICGNGKVTGEVSARTVSVLNIVDGSFNTVSKVGENAYSDINILGGSFLTEPKQGYIVSGASASQDDDDVWTVVPNDDSVALALDYVNNIPSSENKTGYYSKFEDALALAQAEGSGVKYIRLQKDVEATSDFIIKSGVFTIDLNGNDVTGDGYVFDVQGKDTKVTFTDTGSTHGTVESKSDYCSSVSVKAGAHVVIEEGNYDGGIDIQNNSSAIINGGTFKSPGNLPVYNEGGTLEFNDGTITGSNLIASICATYSTKIKGGSFTDGTYGTIAYAGGLLDLSEYPTADITNVSVCSMNDVTVSENTFLLPDGYCFYDADNNEADELEAQTIYTIGKKQDGSSSTHPITLYANNGTGTTEAGDSFTLSKNLFTYDKCEIVSWNTEADGSGVSYEVDSKIENVSGNIKLYAQWVLPLNKLESFSLKDYEWSGDGSSSSPYNLTLKNGTTLYADVIFPSNSNDDKATITVNGDCKITGSVSFVKGTGLVGSTYDSDLTIDGDGSLKFLGMSSTGSGDSLTVKADTTIVNDISICAGGGLDSSVTIDNATLTTEGSLILLQYLTMERNAKLNIPNGTASFHHSPQIVLSDNSEIYIGGDGESCVFYANRAEESNTLAAFDTLLNNGWFPTGYNFNTEPFYHYLCDSSNNLVTSPLTIKKPGSSKPASSSSGGGVSRYTVKFDTDGGTAIANKTVTRNSKLAIPEAPAKDGYTFVGWYTDKELTKAYNFETKVTEGFTLYAKWEKVDDDNQNENGGTTGKDECDGTKADNCPAVDFTDVDTSAWYHLNIDYCLENGLMKGTQADKFEPNANLTRAMLVTILYRAEGEPTVSGITSFADLKKGQYYLDAVCWAQQNGIVKGVSKTEFAPELNITREQIAAILYRYAQYKGFDTAQNGMAIREFEDYETISEYAKEAMQWAVNAGLIKGYENNTIRPLNNATRAEAAALLQRFLQTISK